MLPGHVKTRCAHACLQDREEARVSELRRGVRVLEAQLEERHQGKLRHEELAEQACSTQA